MNEGISLDQACEMRALSPEDFAKSCSDDGSVKADTETTTFSLKNTNSQSFTIDNTVLLFGAASLVFVFVLGGVILSKKRRKVK